MVVENIIDLWFMKHAAKIIQSKYFEGLRIFPKNLQINELQPWQSSKDLDCQYTNNSKNVKKKKNGIKTCTSMALN